MNYIIAVDLGTTLIKCTLFDAHGQAVAAQSLACELAYPAPLCVEQDATLWYEGVCEIVRELVAPYDKEKIKGLCIAAQGISVVPVDEKLRPLSNAISWLDTRAAAQGAELATLLRPEAWFSRTGKFLYSTYTLPKILWMRKHWGAIWARTDKFLMALDYVNARMTGNAVTDHTMAAGTLCYDVARGDWSDEILELTGLRRDQLAQIAEAGTLVGCLNAETARNTGLSVHTQVFNGGQDQKVAAYAAGIHERRASLSLGTAGALEIFVNDAKQQNFLPFFPYVLRGQTLVEGCINTTGAAIKWMKDTVCSDISYDEMNRLAQDAPPGAGGLRLYPHLAKPGTPHRGIDEYASIVGLSLRTGRGELVRALYEGLAYEIRLNLESARSAGSAVTELIVFGGASKSAIFCQIIANVTDLRVCVAQNSEMGSVGAAKLAAKGLGMDAERFAGDAVAIAAIFQPQATALYHEFYQSYRQFYER